MGRFRKSSISRDEFYKDQHRFEHWLRNNTIYFITARCRDKTPAFASDEAKEIFWDCFNKYTVQFGFVPWLISLLDTIITCWDICEWARTLAR
jgi:hypothetical protein